ncbi:MAG: hypothetical protein FD188_3310 [Ignavibacteria bacterium]|nr:MAG: hypothetical protein FD188_3310 [Ignavibacteria bacterium]
MANSDQANLYYQVYESQRGGEYPVYRGTRYIQYGSGFGDVLRGFFRNVLPVVARGAATFFGNMVNKRDEGSNWATAAKAAIAPTAMSVVSEAAKKIQEKLEEKKEEKKEEAEQKGQGRRGRKRVYKRNKHKRKSSSKHYSKVPKFNF